MVAKRVSIDWKFQPKKCAKGCYTETDRISELPDDVLITILCLLPMKEAARTSVLSSRWINLWKHISCLDFEAESALFRIARDFKLQIEESGNYVNWVNRVVRSHKGSNLKEFRACFYLSRSDEDAITQWLEFALLRHVEKLELDFSPRAVNKGNRVETYYAFPEKFLKPPSQSCFSINFNSLKALSLKCVTVTAEAIEILLLRMCPLLEKLVVHYSNEISKLEVCGPSLALKYLELCFCQKLRSLKVSAPNLTSLIGPCVGALLLEYVPMLVEVSVNCMHHDDSPTKLLPKLCCCVSQLEILTLILDRNREVISVLSTFPQLPKLKKLVIGYWPRRGKSLLGLTHLIRASPNLQEFVLELMPEYPRRSDGEVKNTIKKFPHEHLKVFKFSGYYGQSSDVKLVGYVLDNCMALEKLIIDPSYPFARPHRPVRPEKLAEEQTSRAYAKKQLEPRVPQHVELVIL